MGRSVRETAKYVKVNNNVINLDSIDYVIRSLSSSRFGDETFIYSMRGGARMELNSREHAKVLKVMNDQGLLLEG